MSETFGNPKVRADVQLSDRAVKRRLLNRAAWADEGSASRALRSLLRRFKNMKEEERAIATQRYQNQPHVAA